jgi:hypothetical protein
VGYQTTGLVREAPALVIIARGRTGQGFPEKSATSFQSSVGMQIRLAVHRGDREYVAGTEGAEEEK